MFLLNYSIIQNMYIFFFESVFQKLKGYKQFVKVKGQINFITYL